MKVKVGDEIYDAEKEAIMVILTDRDKQLIKDMHPDCSRYCAFPREKYTEEEIKKWMDEV